MALTLPKCTFNEQRSATLATPRNSLRQTRGILLRHGSQVRILPRSPPNLQLFPTIRRAGEISEIYGAIHGCFVYQRVAPWGFRANDEWRAAEEGREQGVATLTDRDCGIARRLMLGYGKKTQTTIGRIRDAPEGYGPTPISKDHGRCCPYRRVAGDVLGRCS